MRIRPLFQENEENFCINEHGSFDIFAIEKTWKCPICDIPLSIKIKIMQSIHSVNRVFPSELKVGELVTLENKHIHEILAISKSENYFRIALKEYTAINVDPDSIITRVMGGWYR